MAKSEPKKMRIGIFGGTFNPIHNGHLNLAKEALKQLKLDKIFFVPTYIPVHKEVDDKIGLRDRLHMLRLAIKGNGRFAVSEYEVKRRRKIYSIDTLKYFKKRFGNKAGLYFIIGSDSLGEIHTWKDIEKAFSLAKFVVGKRHGYPIKCYTDNIVAISIKESRVSSSDIRGRIKENRPFGTLVPKAVAAYIKKRALYRTAQ